MCSVKTTAGEKIKKKIPKYFLVQFYHQMRNINFCHQSNHCPFQPFWWWHQNGVLLNCLLRSLGEGNGTPLQCSCLGNPMDGRAWWATVHGVAQSRTPPSDFTFTFQRPKMVGREEFYSESFRQHRFELLKAASCAQSCLTLCDPMDGARQAPLSMEFSRQEYRRGLSFPPPGDLSNPGIKLSSPGCPALTGRFLTWKARVWTAQAHEC